MKGRAPQQPLTVPPRWGAGLKTLQQGLGDNEHPTIADCNTHKNGSWCQKGGGEKPPSSFLAGRKCHKAAEEGQSSRSPCEAPALVPQLARAPFARLTPSPQAQSWKGSDLQQDWPEMPPAALPSWQRLPRAHLGW